MCTDTSSWKSCIQILPGGTFVKLEISTHLSFFSLLGILPSVTSFASSESCRRRLSVETLRPTLYFCRVIGQHRCSLISLTADVRPRRPAESVQHRAVRCRLCLLLYILLFRDNVNTKTEKNNRKFSGYYCPHDLCMSAPSCGWAGAEPASSLSDLELNTISTWGTRPQTPPVTVFGSTSVDMPEHSHSRRLYVS